MSLKEQIDADLKKAMLEKNKDDLRALRGIKSLILLAQTEKGAVEELTAEVETRILQKAVKQRMDSIAIFREQNRHDLADVEQSEVEVINRYLPAQMTEEELMKKVQQIITQSGASSMKDMGRIMGIAGKELAGSADGKAISEVVKKLLS